MNSFKHVGVWWAPGKRDQKQYGVLTFEPGEGARLEITVEGHSDHFGLEYPEYEVILGVVGTDPYTLTNCYVSGALNSYSPSFTTRKREFTVNLIVEGHHFSKKDDIKFRHVTLSYSYLDVWMNKDNFKFKTSSDSAAYSISYSPFQPVTASDSEVEIEFGFGHMYPGLDACTRQVSLSDEAYIRVTPLQDQSIDELFLYSNHYLPMFLTLASEHPNYPLNVRGTLVDVYEVEDLPLEVKMHYTLRGAGRANAELYAGHLLFSYDDVKDNLETYLQTWIELCRTMPTVVSLVSRLLYDTGGFTDVTFLLLAQTLEAYHRHRYGGVYVSEQEYQPILEALKQAVDQVQADQPVLSPAHKAKLKSSLEFAFEYSFRKRLKEICSKRLHDYEEVIEDLYGSADWFVNTIKETRDFLTHRLVERRPQVVPAYALNDYNLNTLFLLRLCLLVDIGLPKQTIMRLLKDSLAYDRAKRRRHPVF